MKLLSVLVIAVLIGLLVPDIRAHYAGRSAAEGFALGVWITGLIVEWRKR